MRKNYIIFNDFNTMNYFLIEDLQEVPTAEEKIDFIEIDGRDGYLTQSQDALKPIDYEVQLNLYEKEDIQKISEGTKIEFRPEINIGSRNGTDDDIVYPNGNLYQDSKLSAEVPKQINEPKNIIDSDSIDADYEEKYDLYDDVVTKDELYDALEESLETNNPDKLKMLLKQEEVNRLKKEIKEKQEKLNKSSRYDTFDDDDF